MLSLAQLTWQTPAWALLMVVIAVAANIGLSVVSMLLSRSSNRASDAQEELKDAERELISLKLDAMNRLMGARLDSLNAKIDTVCAGQQHEAKQIEGLRREFAELESKLERRLAPIEARLGMRGGEGTG